MKSTTRCNRDIRHATQLRLLAGPLLATLAVAGCGTENDQVSGDQVAVKESAVVGGGPIYDNHTQCTVGGVTMHCCPPGYAMVGIYAGSGSNEWFKCRGANLSGPSPFLDTGTQRTIHQLPPLSGYTTMHACPIQAVMNGTLGKTVMVGYHGSDNKFACQQVYDGDTEYLDVGTQDTDPHPGVPTMHVCAYPAGMSGFHGGKNQLGCLTN